MSRFAKIVAAMAIVPVVAIAAPVSATVQSSVEGGDIYRVKNVTKNGSFSDPANADACDTLMYQVRIHNPGPEQPLTNVTVSAAFPTAASNKNVSIVTARAANASPSNTSDTATVNISTSQKVSYVNGTTQLLDADGNVIKTLSDGITGSGVNIGNVGVSIGEKRFVRFQAKVNCSQPTPTPPTTPKPTPAAPVVEGKTTELPNTGVGSVLGVFAGASSAGAAAHLAVRRFRK